MINQAIARDLLAVLCGLQGLATLGIDLNSKHARNTAWTGHARFHVAWQTSAFVLLAMVEIALLFAPGPAAAQRFYLAALLAAVPMLGFFLAFLGRTLYGGQLADVNGMRPLSVRLFGMPRQIDLNLAAEVVGLLSLIVLVFLFRHAGLHR
ncbi:MAG: hypothetical protein ACLGPM_02465 [Acidobacteriota bacterium]